MEAFLCYFGWQSGDVLSLQTQLKGLPEWISRARELTGLKGVPLDDVLPVFADAADSQGSLDRDAFNRAFLSFIPSSVNKREVAQLLSGVLCACCAAVAK